MKRILVALLFAFTLAAWPAQAVTALSSTTLAAAVTDVNASSISVTSATGFTVGYGLYVDREYMVITSISGTRIGVARGWGGTVAKTHLNAATVIVGPAAAFQTVDQSGSCVVANQLYSVLINISNGNIWLCRSISGSVYWTATNTAYLTYNSILLSGH